MKTTTAVFSLFFAALLFTGFNAAAQASGKTAKTNQPSMKTFVIEREIPDAGKLTPEQLKAISQKSCTVLKELGPEIKWLHSYVTGNKIYCIYEAENEELVRQHAVKGGFPANKIVEVGTVISPATAEQ